MGGRVPATVNGFCAGGGGTPVVGLALAVGSDISNETLSKNIELNNLTRSYPGEGVQASNKLLCVQQPMNDVLLFFQFAYR